MADTPDSLPATAAEAASASARLRTLEEMLATVLIGQRQALRESLITLIAAGHALIEGLPGVGKTLLVRALCAAIAGRFARVQFTPDLMPSDISGHALFDPRSGDFRIRRGPIFTNLLLGDEINRAPAKTQAAMLEAMQEQQVTIEGQSLPLAPPFLVFATQNPIEQEGTYPLPQAQLDRFLVKILIAHPEEQDEIALVRQTTEQRLGDQLDLSAVRPLLDADELIALQRLAARLRLDEEVLTYGVRLVRAARTWQGVESGPGPRAGIALIRAARAQALIEGRDFVIPDDIKALAPAVLRHRLRLSAELEIEGWRPDDLLRDLLDQVPAPRR